jgi:hypothetical protein
VSRASSSTWRALEGGTTTLHAENDAASVHATFAGRSSRESEVREALGASAAFGRLSERKKRRAPASDEAISVAPEANETT